MSANGWGLVFGIVGVALAIVVPLLQEFRSRSAARAYEAEIAKLNQTIQNKNLAQSGAEFAGNADAVRELRDLLASTAQAITTLNDSSGNLGKVRELVGAMQAHCEFYFPAKDTAEDQ